MEDGAFGLGTALIYPPGNYASTEELIEIAKAMAPYGGIYITHMRSEADQVLEGMDEALRIGREGGVPVEIYHLKAAGTANWSKEAAMIAKIDSARAAGFDVQATMYPYTAGGTGLAACLPPSASADGKLQANLADDAARAKIRAEVAHPTSFWESLCEQATPQGVLIAALRNPANQKWSGHRLVGDCCRHGEGLARYGDGSAAHRAARHRDDVLPHERGQRQAAAQAAVDDHRHRCRRHRSRQHEVAGASALVRDVSAHPRQVRARRARDPARGRDSQDDERRRGAAAHRGSWAASARHVRGRRRVRSAAHSRKTPRTKSHCSSPPGCTWCSSTASRSCATAGTQGRSPGASCAGLRGAPLVLDHPQELGMRTRASAASHEQITRRRVPRGRVDHCDGRTPRAGGASGAARDIDDHRRRDRRSKHAAGGRRVGADRRHAIRRTNRRRRALPHRRRAEWNPGGFRAAPRLRDATTHRDGEQRPGRRELRVGARSGGARRSRGYGHRRAASCAARSATRWRRSTPRTRCRSRRRRA